MNQYEWITFSNSPIFSTGFREFSWHFSVNEFHMTLYNIYISLCTLYTMYSTQTPKQLIFIYEHEIKASQWNCKCYTHPSRIYAFLCFLFRSKNLTFTKTQSFHTVKNRCMFVTFSVQIFYSCFFKYIHCTHCTDIRTSCRSISKVNKASRRCWMWICNCRNKWIAFEL